MDKTLHNSTVSGARVNVKDINVFGDGDAFKLISKASSKAEGWMKSTKAMGIDGVGCLVQVTTQQGDNVAEALQFVPGVRIELINGCKSNGRRLVNMHPTKYNKELLLKLLFDGENTSFNAPKSTSYGSGMKQVIVGVGNDEVATICLHENALKYLGL